MKRLALCAFPVLLACCGAPAMSGSYVESAAEEPAQRAVDACDDASDAQLAALERRGEALAVPSEPIAEQTATDCLLTDESYAAGFARQLAERERTLSDAGTCEQICELVASVCQLGERICGLADQTKAPSIIARCTDGRTRCEDAKRRASERCECS